MEQQQRKGEARFWAAVPFPLAGDGAVLRFTTADLIAVEENYGPNWMRIIGQRLEDSNVSVMQFLLQKGLKGQDKVAGLPMPWGDLPFGLYESATPIMNAVSAALSGMTYAQVLAAQEEEEKRQRTAEEERLAGDPEADPTMGSEEEAPFSGPSEPGSPAV